MEMRFFSNDYKKYILLFPLCILIGAVIINALGVDKLGEWNFFTPEYIQGVLSVNTEFMDILKYMAEKRLKHFVIIFLVCFSKIKDSLLLIIVGILGLCFGIMLGSLYMQYGFNALWFYLVFVVGHILIYTFATVLMLYLSEKNKSILSSGYMVCFILIIMGILLESVMSWLVFPKLMSFFF